MQKSARPFSGSLVLIGMMGAGKSSVGRRLADRLLMPFYDSDAEIVQASGHSIPDFFSIYGAEAFHQAEYRVFQRLLNNSEPCIIGAGGAAYIQPETRALIDSAATSVWLNVPYEILLKRVGDGSGRPRLAGDPAGKLRALLDEREETYGLAQFTITTGDSTPDAVARTIISVLEQSQ